MNYDDYSIQDFIDKIHSESKKYKLLTHTDKLNLLQASLEETRAIRLIFGKETANVIKKYLDNFIQGDIFNLLNNRKIIINSTDFETVVGHYLVSSSPVELIYYNNGMSQIIQENRHAFRENLEKPIPVTSNAEDRISLIASICRRDMSLYQGITAHQNKYSEQDLAHFLEYFSYSPLNNFTKRITNVLTLNNDDNASIKKFLNTPFQTSLEEYNQ